jgi:translation initiation factor IF-3
LATEQTRINHQIRSPELRVIGAKGENYGVISLKEALEKANEAGLDLIEISAKANPPVAKIMDYGKYQYDENKKQKASKSKASAPEIKSLQVKIGTGEHDLELKAKRASEWLKEGHRIKVDLYLTGRSKYLEFNFLKERLERILKLITEDFKSDEPKKTPKGLSVMLEKASKK